MSAPRRTAAAGVGLAAMALIAAACSGGSTTTAPPSSTPVVYRWGVVGSKGAISATERTRPVVVPGVTGSITQIASSNSNGFALTSTGTVWAWGAGAYGELGNGTRPTYVTTAVQVDFPAGVRITSLANPMPFDGGLAIDSTGEAWGWGLNADGDLCASSAVNVRPTRLPLSDVTLATGARTHSLFAAGGRVVACGSGADGVLGNGSTASSATPTPVPGLPTGTAVTALTSSWEGSGALFANGDYYNWGYNAAGQLGNGSTTDSDVPVLVHLRAAVRQVSQGGSGPNNGQTIAILADGSTWAWGNNRRGQLGIGTRVSATLPVAVKVPQGTSFTTVDSGGYACYAIDRSGRLWAWGANQQGQLGIGGGPAVVTLPRRIGLAASQVSSTAQNVAALGPR